MAFAGGKVRELEAQLKKLTGELTTARAEREATKQPLQEANKSYNALETEVTMWSAWEARQPELANAADRAANTHAEEVSKQERLVLTRKEELEVVREKATEWIAGF